MSEVQDLILSQNDDAPAEMARFHDAETETRAGAGTDVRKFFLESREFAEQLSRAIASEVPILCLYDRNSLGGVIYAFLESH